MGVSRRAGALFVLGLVAGAAPAGAVSRKLTLTQVVTQGKSVLVGSVLSSSTRWGEGKKMVWTDYEVFVEEIWKGNPGRIVTLSFAGGTVDGRSVLVSHVPRLEVGATYVFALNDLTRLFASPVVGAEQGLFREVTDRATGKRILLDVDGWAVGFDSTGGLNRLAPTEPADAPGVVILRRDAPRSEATAGESPRRPGLRGATYSDGSGNPLPAPSGLPTLKGAASRGAATGGQPLTRDALREEVRRVLLSRERDAD